MLNLSDYSLTRDELPLALEACAVCHAIGWMHSSYPSSPFKGSSALRVPTGPWRPSRHALTAWCVIGVSVFVELVLRNTL